ncbi:MAG: hypothetical protein KC983_05285, partial [Phycisphaerales bacterium]|nr:hypothetical protein [Phycisphaerales bacterium]
SATCATVSCPQPGACCLSDGTCRQELIIGGAQCAADGGTYQGDDTTCATVSCPGGACCVSDGSCSVLSQPDCLAIAGVWQGINTVCTPNLCPQPGACCFPDGTCAVEAETGGAFCLAMAGVYQGDGTSCATTNCPGGACCFGDGSCVVQNEPDCENAGGIWQGLNTVCAVATCPPAGACCFPSGTCTALTNAACTDAGGTWSGAGTLCINVACSAPPSRGNSSQKGSLLIFSKVEVRWNPTGGLIQDTFIQLTNDYNNDVQVQLYFINGDAPIPATGNDRAHPGWNWVDNLIHLTGDQTTTWAVSTGLPAGVSPFTVLDPGIPPGRPVDPANPNGERVLRGFVIGFAVNGLGQQIKWNHLAGEATIVHYGLTHAWSYMAYAFAVANSSLAQGQVAGPAGQLVLDGVTYEAAPDLLLLNFDASNLDPNVSIDTALTLHPVSADLRQETTGPVTTKASFEVWNQNEIKFSGADRCITCWDCVLLSQFAPPNHFLRSGLQTDKGKARIQGLKSQLCDVDFDPNNNNNFPFPPGPGD